MNSKSVQAILGAQDPSEKYFNWMRPLETLLPWTPLLKDKNDNNNNSNSDISMQALQAFAEGKYPSHIPMIFGTVSQEAILFLYEAAKNPVDLKVMQSTYMLIWQ